MALRCKVDDAGHFLILHELVHLLEVADVRLHELVIRHVLYVLEGSEVSCVCKFVNVDDVVVRILVDEESYDVRADEAGAAGDDYRTVCIHDVDYYNSSLRLSSSIT